MRLLYFDLEAEDRLAKKIVKRFFEAWGGGESGNDGVTVDRSQADEW